MLHEFNLKIIVLQVDGVFYCYVINFFLSLTNVSALKYNLSDINRGILFKKRLFSWYALYHSYAFILSVS